MKKGAGVLILLVILFLLPACANATTMDFYTDGTIVDGNVFDTVNVWNTATVDMTDGWAFYCNLYDSSKFNFYDGDVGVFSTYQSAIVNAFADDNPGFDIYNQSQVHLFNSGSPVNVQMFGETPQLHIYGYNLEYHLGVPDVVTGIWPDNRSFVLGIRNSFNGTFKDNVFLHEIPEPATLSLFGLIALFIRKRGNIK